MPNPEIGEEEKLRIALTEKFGDRYSMEKFVEAGGYFFYRDMINLSTNEARDNEGVERRFYQLSQSLGRLEEFARILRRYGIKQEQIGGVGYLGGNPYVLISNGLGKDDAEDGKMKSAKLWMTIYKVENGKKETAFEGVDGDLERYGIRVIDFGGAQFNVLDVKEDPVVGNETKIDEILIDGIVNRLKRFDTRIGSGVTGWKNLLKNLPESDLRESKELFVARVMETMDLVSVDSKDVDASEDKLGKEFVNILESSLKSCSAYLVDRYTDTAKLWKEIESAMYDDKQIYVWDPDGLMVLPALYLFVQGISQKKPGDDNVALGCVKKYWKLIKVLSKSELLASGQQEVRLVIGKSAGFDVESNPVDIPAVSEIRRKFGKNLLVFDFKFGEVR